MASLKQLVEQSVLEDLRLDGAIAHELPHAHEYNRMKSGDDENQPERPVAITVTATDLGEFYPNSGIRKVAVAVEIIANAGSEEIVDPTLLDTLAEKVSDRLPATQDPEKSRHLAFNTDKLKIFGIMNEEGDGSGEVDLSRERVINCVFVVAQLS